ncbi:hypothetical protein PR048_007297 [Dryococelus australis]|uniref:Uncharacterized protein n=1 Tax=Dryococelus australis TaxID=614101 RepID=A0ABQ9ID90_9NEOP|nr:hypothetical protein PR048_007297 [Dryococelus australis]
MWHCYILLRLAYATVANLQAEARQSDLDQPSRCCSKQIPGGSSARSRTEYVSSEQGWFGSPSSHRRRRPYPFPGRREDHLLRGCNRAGAARSPPDSTGGESVYRRGGPPRTLRSKCERPSAPDEKDPWLESPISEERLTSCEYRRVPVHRPLGLFRPAEDELVDVHQWMCRQGGLRRIDFEPETARVPVHRPLGLFRPAEDELVDVHQWMCRQGGAGELFLRSAPVKDDLTTSADLHSAWNERAWEAGYPRENLSTSGTIRHDYHMKGNNAWRHEISTCTKSPFRAMNYYDFGRKQFMQGDTLKVHIEICKDSSTGSHQVLSLTPHATSSRLVWNVLLQEVDELQNKQRSALNTDNDHAAPTKNSTLDIKDETVGEDDHEDSVNNNYENSVDRIFYHKDYDSLDVPTHFISKFPSTIGVKNVEGIKDAASFATTRDMEKAEDAENSYYTSTEDPNELLIDILSLCNKMEIYRTLPSFPLPLVNWRIGVISDETVDYYP